MEGSPERKRFFTLAKHGTVKEGMSQEQRPPVQGTAFSGMQVLTSAMILKGVSGEPSGAWPYRQQEKWKRYKDEWLVSS